VRECKLYNSLHEHIRASQLRIDLGIRAFASIAAADVESDAVSVVGPRPRERVQPRISRHKHRARKAGLFLSGPKRREGLHVERWVRTDCGAERGRDTNAAVNLRTPGTAGAEVTRAVMAPLPARASLPARVVDEPHTATARTCAHV
jgi:transposase